MAQLRLQRRSRRSDGVAQPGRDAKGRRRVVPRSGRGRAPTLSQLGGGRLITVLLLLLLLVDVGRRRRVGMWYCRAAVDGRGQKSADEDMHEAGRHYD